MAEKNKKLTVLWTTDNLITVKDMVFMYTINAKKMGWWDEITLLIWGAASVVAANNEEIQGYFETMKDLGIHLTACKACADNHKVSERLEALGIEVKYWGTGLTEVLQGDGKLLTV